MDWTVLRKVAGMGIVVLLLVAMMYLFALNKVVESAPSTLGVAVDRALEVSLEPGAVTRVELEREGPEISAPRIYTLHIRPGRRALEATQSVSRLCLRAAEVVSERLRTVRVPVTIRVIAETASGRTIVAHAVARGANSRDELVSVPWTPPEFDPNRAKDSPR